MATPIDSRHRQVDWLARTRFARLVAVARRAGAGTDAEDAVQDVLVRLAGAAVLPSDPDRLTAYAATAVRREALRGRSHHVDLDDDPTVSSDPVGAHERDRAVRAFVVAIRPLAERDRAVLVLDAAGWSRRAIAGHLAISERVVSRSIDDHRAAALARAAAALDGSDCSRLRLTLSACAVTGYRPRPAGPVADHLEVCDACRSALARARATRSALAALFPIPLAPAIGGTGVATAVVARRIVATAVAVTAGATAIPLVRHSPRPAPTRAPNVAPPPATPAPGPTPRALAPPSSPTRAHRVVITVSSRPTRIAQPPPAAPAPAAIIDPPSPPTSTPPDDPCALGDSGICGLR